MKKLLILILFVGSLFASQKAEAQRININTTSLTSSTYGALTDTVTSTSPKYLVSAVLPATQTKSWTISYPTLKYIRVKTVGISTPNFTVAAKIYGVARQ